MADSSNTQRTNGVEVQRHNLGFPAFGLHVLPAPAPAGTTPAAAGPRNVLVCAGGGGGAAKTGFGNGFGFFHFYASPDKDHPTFHPLFTHETDTHFIPHLSLHPTGNYLACGRQDSCVTYSYDVKTKTAKEEQIIQTDFAPKDSEQKCSVFSPSGTTLLTGGMDGTVRLWKWPSLPALAEIKAHREEVFAADWDPTSDSRFATINGTTPECKVWEVQPPKADSKKSDKKAKHTLACVHTFTLSEPGLKLRGVKFSPDGKQLFAVAAKMRSDSFIYKWDLSTSPPRTSFVKAHTRAEGAGQTLAVCAKYVATGTADGNITVFQPHNLSWIMRCRAHDILITKLAFHPDMTHVFSVAGDYHLCATKITTTRGFVSAHGNWLAIVCGILVVLLAMWWS